MKYCEISTREHPLSIKHNTCLEQIDQIITRENGNSRLFGTSIALNLDLVEKNLKQHQPQATVDFCFGISNNLVNRHFVLAELKLGVKNPKTIKKSDLIEKVNGSINLLSRGIPIYIEYYFIFNNNQKEVARSHFRLLFFNKPKNPYIPLKLNDLHTLFFIS